MTTGFRKSLLTISLFEFPLAIAAIAGLINLGDFFHIHGYLPAPFVFDVSDTFMDWFNTAYWAHNPGAYEVWNSVYAPLSFVILRIFGESHCYATAPKDARDCDVVGIICILISYWACFVIAAVAFWKRDRATAVFRTIGFGFGLPLLYALERGNLILIAIFFFILLFGDLVKSRKWISFTAAIIINLKSYLLFPVLAFAIKREWRKLELCGFATVGLYLVTIVIMNAGTPFDLAANLKIWFNAMSGVVWDQVYYSTTYGPYLLFDERNYPIREFIEQQTVDFAKTCVVIELIASRSIAWLCLICAYFYPRAISVQRVAFFAIMQTFVVQNPGGYAIAIVTFLVLLERWDGILTGLSIILAYVISIPTDRLVGTFYSYGREAWLSNRLVDSAYGMSVGALARPGLLAIMLWVLAIDSLIRFHRAAQIQKPTFNMMDRSVFPPMTATA